jgi:CheY-like chemotaxis protein
MAKKTKTEIRKKVMIIDDDKEFLEELEEMLASSGYQAVAVNDSSKALSEVLKVKPDIILLDMKMKGLNGFQVAKQIKSDPKVSKIPVIAMSAYFGNGGSLSICDDNIRLNKPFNPLDVIARIEGFIGPGCKSKKGE